ncbi:MAG: hypothetical protein CEE43_02195 [Promethearchaeota archaeon Loki_b32]|nr:MAG: hypothetical protein CEE43_02195 [Candidatus Lokiarchaeota archaeon Loki_b32]
MKEIIHYDKRNALNLLNRLLRIYPFSIQTTERSYNSYRYHSENPNNMANYFWFDHIFNELDKNGFNIGLAPHTQYDIEIYNKLMESIIIRIKISLNNINKKPKEEGYILNYDFIFLRVLFKCLYDYLHNLRTWLRNEYFGKTYIHIPFIYIAINDFSDDFIENNLSTQEEYCELVNRILSYFGFDFISLGADGILRYFGTTPEAEEKKKAIALLHKKQFKNVIEYLDTFYDHIYKRDYNNALAESRNVLESFYKTLLLKHNITEIEKRGKSIGTEDGEVNPLAETIRKNVDSIFEFPEYSKNMDKSVKSLIESSKTFISGMANPAGSHGQVKKPKVKFKEVKAVESFLTLLFNCLLPFER